MEFLSYLINGISLGSVYAIIALGYTMVYGIAKMLNFAHGDVIMVGSYIVFIAVNQMGMPPLLAIIISMALCTLLGIVIERFAYKPLRSASSLAVLITAIGVSYLLQNLALLIWGADPKSFTSVVGLAPVQLAGGRLVISGETIVTIVVSAVIMAGLIFFVNNTKMGRAMLAVSEDKGAAQLMGINVNSTIAMTFAIGSALAGALGVLLLEFPVGHHGDVGLGGSLGVDGGQQAQHHGPGQRRSTPAASQGLGFVERHLVSSLFVVRGNTSPISQISSDASTV